MKASGFRWELPIFLIVFLVLLLSLPMFRGIRGTDELAVELDQLRQLWFETVVIGALRGPDEGRDDDPLDFQHHLEGSRVFGMVRFSPELGAEFERLVELSRAPPEPETIRRTERQFSEVRSLVGDLESQSTYAYQSLLAFLVLLLVGFAVVHRQQGARLRALAAEQENARRTQRLALTVQEQERHRIARELHDETAQSLALAGMIAEQLEAGEQTARLREILSGAMRDIRNVCERMRPPADWADKPGEMIHSLCASLEERYPLRVNLSLRGDLSVEWDDEVYLHLYRIAQEILVNVIRHAGTDEAWVRLDADDGETIRLTITDRGKGLNGAEAGLGRRGVIERAELIGATIRWFEPADGGTGVSLRLNRRLRKGAKTNDDSVG